MPRKAALVALLEIDPREKSSLARLFDGMPRKPLLGETLEDIIPPNCVLPGRPAQPELVHPARAPKRGLGTDKGRAILLHAIAHIEFNAINLALDAAVRFTGMPDDYYYDWLQVAAEEALHFTLLNDHLATYGYRYGDFAAHNSLWELAERTQSDVLARMGLVPRINEARGLDVTPGIRDKLQRHGETRAAEILDIILADEVGHVAIGNKWFRHLCEERGLAPLSTFIRLMSEVRTPNIKPPINREARLRGGFTEEELTWLEAQAAHAAAAAIHKSSTLRV